MDEKEHTYFDGRCVDEEERIARRCYWRRVGFVIFLSAAVALILGPLLGCATAEEEMVAKVCYMRVMGRTEDGNTVVMQACQSPESFKSSQQ